MGNLAGMLAVDAARRREQAERLATSPTPLERAVYNRCIRALSELADPVAALGVTEKIARSICEYLTASSRCGR